MNTSQTADLETDDPGLSTSELRLFFLQLSVMLGSGISLLPSLETLAQDRSRKLDFVSDKLATTLSSGYPLSKALGRLPYSFDPIIVALIAIGEKTGKLDLLLKELAKRVDSRCRYRQHVIQALTYPVMVMLVSIGLILLLSHYMLPVMLDLTQGMEVEIPWPTRFLMALVNLKWLALLLFVGFVFVLCDLYWGLRDETSDFRNWVLYRSPVLGELNNQRVFMELCQDLALMLDAGCLLTQALSALSPASPDPQVGIALLKVKQDLMNGETLEQSLANHPEFPKLVSASLAVGSEVGRPQHLLKTVVVLLKTELETRTERLIAMIEPITMAVLGLVVGGILLASLLPIYSVVTGSL